MGTELLNKKNVIWLLAIFLLATSSVAYAQQPKKVILVGYVSSGDAASDSNRVEGLRMALRERGHVEGQNIAFEYRYGDGKVERGAELVADLMRLQVDIIVVAGGTFTIQAAKDATKTIPIVMLARGSDPVEAGLVASLARPGGNVTGLTLLSRELGGKRLELLKEAVPKISRVAVFYDPAFRPSVIDVKDVLPVAARALGLNLQPWEIRSADDFDRVFAAMGKQRPDGLYVPAAGSLIRSNQKRIAGLALKEPVTVSVRRQRSGRWRRAHVLRGGPGGELPARGLLRGQDLEGNQARRFACGAADEV